MASIVLSSIGTAVGAASGLPFGSQLGNIIGAGVANRLGGGSKHHYEGARLETLAVQTSTYGRMIPIVFGTVRIAGNVIWSLPIKELATTTKTSTGGKAGGGAKSTSTSTTYSYSITLAIAICEGEISRVHRVWADAQVLDMSQGTYRIYKGTETQLPDPLIESYQGIGSTPAYRGMAYIVIEDFPMGDFGNRIPNFTFEITRKAPQGDVDAAPVESLVKSVMLIPGSGEFVYDTQTQYKIAGVTAGGNVVQSGYQVALNQHTPEGKANSLVALDQLQETFPNLEWVGVVVNWFGTTMDIATCEIWPSVEYQANTQTTPDSWQVAGLTRATARQIGNDAGVLRYGGTPDDDSIVRLLTEIKARGLKVFFYPQLLMDVAGKPWRGELTGASTAISDFFTKTRGYNAFITHYANLTVGKIDAFAIGTEMRDLTKITISPGVFPAVSQLISLASTVKGIVGGGVKVTYAADWSEYHHTDGGWYHLDPLWASSGIDVVGIDAYFPLSDALQTSYDMEALKQGWVSGEGYDWYYTDTARTTQASLAPAYAWKNIEWWWKNAHTNPGGGATAWVPESKPIWFTEFGFPSVDGCANQPNVFVDSSAAGSAYPRFSRGRVDFMAQRTAISATLAQWGGSTMVTNSFLWTWDARPYPHWPDLMGVWADGANWVTGHWVQGKLGSSHVAGVVEQIATRAGLLGEQIDTSRIQMILDGYIIADQISARAAIEQLMNAYFFSVRESGGVLVAMPRDSQSQLTVDASVCIEQKLGEQSVPYVLTRKEDLVLPKRQEVHFLHRLQRYETNVQAAERGVENATDVSRLSLSLVLSPTHAKAIAETLLADQWAERSEVSLQLPIAFGALEPGDLITLTDGTAQHVLRIRQTQIGRPGMVRIKAVIDGSQLWDGYISPVAGSDGSQLLPNPLTKLEYLDIPALPGDAPDALTLRFAACGVSAGWRGASLIRNLPTGDDEILLRVDKPATMGAALTVLGAGSSNLIDEVNTVDVALLGNVTLSSTTEAGLLNGANAAVLGNEIIQFMQAEVISAGVYRLSRLLRGRQGTDVAMTSHAIEERFVLLDEAVQPIALPSSHMGQVWNLRASTFGDALSSGVTSSFTIQGNSLKPLAPIDAIAIRDGATGDIEIRWKRRTRIEASLRDYVDVPLNELQEQYSVQLFNGAVLLRSWQMDAPQVDYTHAAQLSDFGVEPNTLSLVIRQLSALAGPGAALTVTIPVSLVG